jgi:sulfatase modifying factor 1
MISFRRALLPALVVLLTSCATKSPSPVTVLPAQPGPNQHQLVAIPSGDFQVGAYHNQRNPLRTVHLKSYRIADTETTNEQFARFIKTTGYVTDAEKRGYGMVSLEGAADWEWKQMNGASWRAPFGPDGPKAVDQPNYPVTQISGADAEAYCHWLGGRLPTLEEWEVAARAGATTHWPWGDTFDLHRANVWNGKSHEHNTREDGWVYTSPVRSFPPNAWGLYDVIGNVFEYCAGLPPTIPPNDADRLIAGRGGSWWCSASTCNFYNLEDIGAMDRHGTLANQGFRIVFDN